MSENSRTNSPSSSFLTVKVALWLPSGDHSVTGTSAESAKRASRAPVDGTEVPLGLSSTSPFAVDVEMFGFRVCHI